MSAYDVVLRKLLLADEFIDVIFDHPEKIHELVMESGWSVTDHEGIAIAIAMGNTP